MKKLSLSFILFCLCTQLWAKASVSLDSSTITQGKPFRLIITDDGYSQVVPDITPLQQDFVITGSEQSNAVTVINNTIQSETRWIIYLYTEKTGKLTIPALNVGGQSTQPLPITVLPKGRSGNSNSPPQHPSSSRPSSAPALPADEPDDVMLTAKADLKKPYLNQQVIYTMRLYNSRRLVDVEFVPPTAKDALMIPLGEGNRYETTHQGVRYAVEEQHYAVFPLKSGKLSITPPQFSALIYDGFPQRIRPTAPTVTLQVQPVPDAIPVATWLPASNVELEEEYSTQSTTVFLGDTLTREITIKAVGITSELLPDYTFTAPQGINLYTDKPLRKNYLQNNEVLGTATFKLTYLFNQSGKMVLPEFRVRWFNTQTKKTEETRLPERTVIIRDQQNSSEANPPPPNKQTLNEQALKELRAIGEKYLPKKKSTVLASWPFILIAVLIILCLLLGGFLYWFWQRKTTVLVPTFRELEQRLKQTCLRNDPFKTRDYFIQWAQLRWPHAHPINLAEAGKLTADQSLMGQINRLSKVIYTSDNAAWTGKEFWQAFENYRSKKKGSAKKNSNPLPPINPY